MEDERRRNKLWTPAHNILFSWRNWEAVENLEKDDDENPGKADIPSIPSLYQHFEICPSN